VTTQRLFNPWNANNRGLDPKSLIEVSSDFELELPKGMTATIDTFNSDMTCVSYVVEYDTTLGEVERLNRPYIKDFETFSFFGVKNSDGSMDWVSWRGNDCDTSSEAISKSWFERMKKGALLFESKESHSIINNIPSELVLSAKHLAEDDISLKQKN